MLPKKGLGTILSSTAVHTRPEEKSLKDSKDVGWPIGDI